MINENPISTAEEKQPISITTKEVILIEVFSVFIIVLSTMFTTIWFDVVEKGHSQFNTGLLGSILFNAFNRTILFLLGYSFARKLYSIARHGIHKGSIFLDDINKRQLFVIHIFAVTVLIICFGSVRPVIQRPIFSDDFTLISDVSVGFTNYDFSHTLYIIIPILLFAIGLMYVFNSRLSKKALVNISIIFLLFASLCSLYNYKDSFDTKILEARGAFVTGEEFADGSMNSAEEITYHKNVGKKVLGIAEEALALSKNDKEKALALRWVAGGLDLQEEYEKAYEVINESIRLDPQDYSYGQLSYTAINLKKYLLAIEAGKICINLNPEASYCYAPLSQAQWHMGDYEQAKETMQNAVIASPHSKLLNDLLLYYEKTIPVKIARYIPEERELRKNNEPVNACLADTEDAYFDLAQKYCMSEGKDKFCKVITGAHWAELETKIAYLRNDCFSMFTTGIP